MEKMETLKAPAAQNSQEIAHIFASRIMEAKRGKKAAKIFSRATQEGRKEDLETIRAELKIADNEYLESKRGNFRQKDKIRLLFQAKSKYLSGMNKEEKTAMFKEAGYTDEEISKITVAKTVVSGGIATGLSFTEHAAKIFVTAKDNFLPITDNLPPSATGVVIAGSLAAYTGAYALFTEGNMKLTKQAGISANPTVSTLYFLSDKLLPNKARDWLSRGTPIGIDAAQNLALYTIPTLAATGDANKVVAATLIATAMNSIYAAGSFAALAIKNKFGKKEK